MNNFFYNPENKTNYTYKQFIETLNTLQKVPAFCYTNNHYNVFLYIVAALLNNTNITLLDYDFSSKEIEHFGIKDINIENPKVFANIKNFDDLLARIKQSTSKICLFTSGTTGIPKKVYHTFTSLAKQVKIHANIDIWGFCYNPTHMGGLQVFFQAFLNQNYIIYLFKQKNPDELINEFKITHISATTSFLRMLTASRLKLESVVRVSSGGEAFDENLINKLKAIFVNAKFLNIYALTEAGTIFASNGNTFVVKPEYEKFVKIDNSELLIHKSLLGSFESEKIIDDWFFTGDKLNIISLNPLKFTFAGRQKTFINVGGYNVNPEEIEARLNNIDGVVISRVYGIKNSLLGNILACEIVTDKKLESKSIRQELATKLQAYKVPRIINFVNEIKRNRAGKIER